MGPKAAYVAGLLAATRSAGPLSSELHGGEVATESPEQLAGD